MSKKNEVLVFQKGVRFFTTSLNIADNFTKTHKEVMRAIKNAHCSDAFRRHNFVLREYTKRGKSTDYCDVSEAGFSWVILGFTGKEYAPWKEKYINTFQYMRNLISDPTRIPHRVENLKSNIDFNAAVEEYKIYVTGVSSAPEKSQMIFNDMVNRALFDFPKGMKKIPDKLSIPQLHFSNAARANLAIEIRKGVEAKEDRNDIKKRCREKVSKIADALGVTPVIPSDEQLNLI